MSKQLKPSGAAYRRLKADREENLTGFAGSINACVKKAENIGRADDEKGGEEAEKSRSIIENEK